MWHDISTLCLLSLLLTLHLVFAFGLTGCEECNIQSNTKSIVHNVAFKKTSVATYQGIDGSPLSKDILADITQFGVLII